MAAAGLPDFTSSSRVPAPRADVRSSAEPGYPLSRVERLAEAPADIVPKDGAQITGFRLSLFKGMGSAETGFIRSVDEAVDRFHAQVVAQVEAPAPRRSRSEEPTG
ncbi:hypothetical protein ACFCX7_29475 [Streptomyces microflavus]|uniref:hypothetical protein n=1 Tax=Streptomyces microflavus TaxID=1919 RepID=UPI0035DED410